MSLATDLKAKSLELRKAQSPLSSTFQMIIADAQAQAKGKGLPDYDDEMAGTALKRALGQAQEALSHSPEDLLLKLKVEEISKVLPPVVSADEVEAEGEAFLKTLGTPLPKSALGDLMKHLMAKYGAALDRAQAVEVARKLVGR